jgi:hypothetical protein
MFRRKSEVHTLLICIMKAPKVTRSAGFQIIIINYKPSVYLTFRYISQRPEQNTKGEERKKRQKQFYWNCESWIIFNFQSIGLNYSPYKIRYTYIIIKYGSVTVETERFFEYSVYAVRKLISSSRLKILSITRLLQNSVSRSQDCYYRSNGNVILNMSHSIPFWTTVTISSGGWCGPGWGWG